MVVVCLFVRVYTVYSYLLIRNDIRCLVVPSGVLFRCFFILMYGFLLLCRVAVFVSLCFVHPSLRVYWLALFTIETSEVAWNDFRSC